MGCVDRVSVLAQVPEVMLKTRGCPGTPNGKHGHFSKAFSRGCVLGVVQHPSPTVLVPHRGESTTCANHWQHDAGMCLSTAWLCVANASAWVTRNLNGHAGRVTCSSFQFDNPTHSHQSNAAVLQHTRVRRPQVPLSSQISIHRSLDSSMSACIDQTGALTSVWVQSLRVSQVEYGHMSAIHHLSERVIVCTRNMCECATLSSQCACASIRLWDARHR